MPPRTGESQQGENRFSLKQISLASLRMRILPTRWAILWWTSFFGGRGGCLIREARGASTNSHLLWLLVFLSLLLARAAALLCSTHDSVLESDSPVSPPNITDAWDPDCCHYLHPASICIIINGSDLAPRSGILIKYIICQILCSSTFLHLKYFPPADTKTHQRFLQPGQPLTHPSMFH